MSLLASGEVYIINTTQTEWIRQEIHVTGIAIYIELMQFLPAVLGAVAMQFLPAALGAEVTQFLPATLGAVATHTLISR